MRQDKKYSLEAVRSTKVEKSSDRNEKRLGTLKLWQKHIEALARPSRRHKPLIKRYDDTPIVPERSH